MWRPSRLGTIELCLENRVSRNTYNERQPADPMLLWTLDLHSSSTNFSTCGTRSENMLRGNRIDKTHNIEVFLCLVADSSSADDRNARRGRSHCGTILTSWHRHDWRWGRCWKDWYGDAERGEEDQWAVKCLIDLLMLQREVSFELEIDLELEEGCRWAASARV